MGGVRKAVSALADTDRKFVIEFGDCLQELPITDLEQTILLCGPKVDLKINMDQQALKKMFQNTEEGSLAINMTHSKSSKSTAT